MIRCSECGGTVIRRQRNAVQRILFRAVYRCADCERVSTRPRSFVTIFRPYVECPRCGARALGRLAAKDRIDGTSPNPLRRMLILFGCPLYHCTFCRMQFRDWRSRQPVADAEAPEPAVRSRATSNAS